jgi:predicted nucleic acid-binding protein
LTLTAAVLDTSTLQALHRAGVLEEVRKLYPDGLSIPQSVERQTRAAFPQFGAAKVPDIDALGWLSVRAVSSADADPYRARQPGQPLRGKSESISQGLTCCGYAIDSEEFDVVVLAKKINAVAILDDHRALKCAQNLGVASQTTRDVLASLSSGGLVGDVDSLVRRIEATGYMPTLRVTKPPVPPRKK